MEIHRKRHSEKWRKQYSSCMTGWEENWEIQSTEPSPKNGQEKAE